MSGQEGYIHGGVRASVVDSNKNEEDINNQNEDVDFQAKAAFVYGFTEEAIKKIKNESMVEIVMMISKMGLKGDVNCKRAELEKRVMEKEYKITPTTWASMEGRRRNLE